MVLQDSILQVIQNIPGSTKAEKLKFICQKGNDIAVKGTSWESIPDVLHHLVTAEVAKKLKETELIIKSLNSDDAFVIQRALYINDLFADEHSPLLRFDYFHQQILSKVPLRVRSRVIKKIASDLTSKDPKIGEEFFLGVSRTYGVKSALELLMACSEDFMYEQILKHRIILSADYVSRLYVNHPNIVIRYLKLSNYEEDSRNRHLHKVRLEDYAFFLPFLIKDHFSEFLDLCETEYLRGRFCHLKLSKTKTKMFLKKGITVLKDKPNFYLKMLDLEVVTLRLKPEDFRVVIGGMFPKELNDCYIDNILSFLRFYPCKSKSQLIQSLFSEVYGDDLYNHPDKISAKLLCLFPTDDRIKYARLKLVNASGTPFSYEDSWRCYLTVAEVIPEIKNQISKCSNELDRGSLIKEMFYVCKVNDDNVALLEVLQYFVERHKNESEDFLRLALSSLRNQYELFKLGEAHWKVLNCFIKRLEVKSYFSCVAVILEDAIHYNIDHNLSIDEYIKLYMSCYFSGHYHNWNILKSFPNYEKLCLEKFLNMVGTLYHDGDKIWKKWKEKTLENFIYSVYNFNNRIKRNRSIIPIDIKNHPWILKNIEFVLKSGCPAKALKDSLRQLDFELYDTLVKKNKCENINVCDIEVVIALKNDYKRILSNWESYFENLMFNALRPGTQKFMRDVRWYNDIPIRFAERSLKMLHETKTPEVIIILGYLLEGSLFEKVIDSLIPLKPVLDVNRDETKKEYEIISSCLKGSKKCNPPVSFKIFKRLCSSDYFPEAVKVIDSIARKSSINEVINFAEYLMQQRVSVKKHGVEVMCLIAPLDQKCSFLLHFWNSETHRSIRNILLPKIKQTFIETPNEQTWNLIQVCFQNQTVDEENVLNCLTVLKDIPDEYIILYIKQAIVCFERLAISVDGVISKNLIKRILNEINSTFDEVLPEEFQMDLIRKYFFDAALKSDYDMMKSDFIFNVYLKNTDVESRLASFARYLVDFLKYNFNKTEEKNPVSYPARKKLHLLITDYKDQAANHWCVQVTKVLKDCLEKTIQPFDDPLDFLSLIWIEKFEKSENVKHFGKTVGQSLESVILLFGREFTLLIASSLNDILTCLNCNTKNYVSEFIEGIMEVKAVYPYLISTELLFQNEYSVPNTKRNEIIEKLNVLENPLVKTAINRYLIERDMWYN